MNPQYKPVKQIVCKFFIPKVSQKKYILMFNVTAPEALTVIKIHGCNGNLKINKSDMLTVQMMSTNTIQKIKCDRKGVVHFKCREGDIKEKDDLLCVLSPCPHDIVVNGYCGLCSISIEIKNCGNGEIQCSTGSRLAILHNNKNVVVKKETAIEISLKDYVTLLKKRKLSLLVDLDATILHSTDKPVSSQLIDVYHYKMKAEQNSAVSLDYHTKFRPFLKHFLTEMNSIYEMHIYTFGNKSYAEKIAEIIDHEKRFFGRRIISKDDSFDPMKKSANLKSLFPRGDNMVCIIDDRTDVWNNAANCIHVQPYIYFPEIGDINDPYKTRTTIYQSAPSSLPADNQSAPSSLPADNQSAPSSSPADNQSAPSSLPADNQPIEKKTESDNLSNSQIHEDSTEKIENASDINKINNSDSSINEAKTLEIEDPNDNFDQLLVDNPNAQLNEDSKENSDKNPDLRLSLENQSPEKIENPEGDLEVKSEIPTKIDNNDEVLDIQLEDRDCYLLSLANILKEIHKRFYEEIDKLLESEVSILEIVQSNRLPDVKQIMSEMRKNILRGCRVNFSGIIPLNLKVKDSYEHRMLTNLGAQYLHNVTLPSLRSKPDSDVNQEFTTHLICKSEGTKKMKQVAHYINDINRLTTEKPERLPKVIHRVHLVKSDWLWQSYFFWQKVNENDFLLNPKLKQCPIPEGFSEMTSDNVSVKKSRKRSLSSDEKLDNQPKKSRYQIEESDCQSKEENISNIPEEDFLKELEGVENESLSGISTDSFEDSLESYDDKDVPLDNIILHYSLQEQLDMLNEVDEAMDEEKYEKLRSPESSDYYNSGSSSSSSKSSDSESSDFKKPPKYWEKQEQSDESTSHDEDHEILDYADCEQAYESFGLSKDNVKSDFDELFDDF